MKRLVLLIFGCLLVLASSGQSEEIDSLKQVLKTDQADSSRVYTLITLSSNFARTDSEKSKELALEAIDLAKEIDFKPGLALAHKAAGLSYYFQTNWIDALVQWQLAMEVFEEMGDLAGMSNILNNIGAIYFNQGDNEGALKNYLKSLKTAEKSNDSLRIVTALINIGTVHLSKPATHNLAFTYYQRALPMSEKVGDYDALGTCAVNIGEIYFARGNASDLDSALYYFEKALDSYEKSSTGNIAFALKSIGTVYAKRGEYEEAIKYQTDAYTIAKGLGGRLEMTQALLSLGETHKLQQDFPKAIEAYSMAEELSNEISSPFERRQAYAGLADVYSATGDYENAYKYKNLYSELSEVLTNSDTEQKIQFLTLNYELEKKQGEITLLQKDKKLKEIELKRQKIIRNGTAIFGVLLLILVAGLFNRYRYTHRTNKIIEKEKERSDELLLNILPHETAEELKANGKATPKYYENASVLFTDFQGFTKIAEQLAPQDLVEELNQCFSAFDTIITKYKLEKIKTIGDSYMCASGLPTKMPENALEIVKAALEIRDYMLTHHKERISQGHEAWDLRIGVHTGPLVAGVVGKNKFAYDIWGDTVNTASRMETSGVTGHVNISGATYEQVKDYFVCTHRGKIKAKNKGEVDMYLVEGYKEAFKPASVASTIETVSQ
ncbi:MAG: adenylate/guanylate cyclase domain-containing protein [Cryomorphaceae bacterium]